MRGLYRTMSYDGPRQKWVVNEYAVTEVLATDDWEEAARVRSELRNQQDGSPNDND